jgi:hypothetical protein
MSVEVLMSNENLSVFGGPASLDVNVDFGPKGDRGSLIFQGPGKPTDAIVSFPTTPQPLDLYINRSPSDFEFLFLYEYGIINGVAGWSKLFRLIPSTALANIQVVFINGFLSTLTPTLEGLGYIDLLMSSGAFEEEVDVINSIFTDLDNITVGTEPPTPSLLVPTYWIEINADPTVETSTLKVFDPTVPPSGAWVALSTINRGLLFPISQYLSSEEIELGDGQGFNIQYVILNESAVSSGLTVGDLSTPETGESERFLPVSIQATEAEPFNPAEDTVAWRRLNGVKILSFVVVAGIGFLPLFDDTPNIS